MSKEDPQKLIHRRIGTEEWARETHEIAQELISELSERHGVSKMVEQLAQAIYSRSLETKCIQNSTIAEISGSSMVIATKKENEPINRSELSDFLGVSERRINKTYTKLTSELELKIGPIDPVDHISHLCDQLLLNEEIEDKATEIVDVCKEGGIQSGRSPSGFAASAVYIAALLYDDPRPQYQVAYAADVSEKTISSTYKYQLYHLSDVGYADMDLDDPE